MLGAAFAAVLLVTSAAAQDSREGELDKSPPKGMAAEEVIRRFTAKEKEAKQAREHYTFRREIKVHTVVAEKVTGEFRQVADIHYEGGRPVKTIVFGPQPNIQLSKEDLEDLETRESFTISTDELKEYKIVYVGQQHLDELHCYVFDVAPKVIEKDKRYFQGRIWVDDRDLQIVRNRGKSVPDIRIEKKKSLLENLFPEFTTWREQVDGKYWFPTFSSADDVLAFKRGDVRIKELLKFTDYKKQ